MYSAPAGAGNDYGEAGAITVKNAVGTPITGEISSGSIGFSFDYDGVLAEREAMRSSQTAQRFLNETDYLFAVDRHARLLSEEPTREAELVAKREEAREAIRKYKSLIGAKDA